MQNMVKEAEKRTAEYDRKEAMVQEDGINTWSDNSRRAYFREFKKVRMTGSNPNVRQGCVCCDRQVVEPLSHVLFECSAYVEQHGKLPDEFRRVGVSKRAQVAIVIVPGTLKIK
jgi:hypothetical protein